ncbi:uncharacterized protein LOC144351799, partial [Saccoglossus kowalevskii]
AINCMQSKAPIKSKCVPGWNDYVKDHHTIARDAFLLWRNNGGPKQGPLSDLMRITRAKFKYVLRLCRDNKSNMRADALANSHLDKNVNLFWKNVGKKKKSSQHSVSIDGYNGHTNIGNMWGKHYANLLSCVSNNKDEQYVRSKLQNRNSSQDMVVRPTEIQCSIHELAVGKSTGPDGISAEHIKHAHDRVLILFSLLFTAAHFHGYLPPNMLETTLVPIVKNKNGDITSAGNYRLIATATAISKL